MKYTQRYYPSNLQGSKIRNAVTGHVYENCLVGSIAEKNFFKVIDSTGNYSTEGTKTRGNRNPNKLFFESYAEFETFYKIGQKGGYQFLGHRHQQEQDSEDEVVRAEDLAEAELTEEEQ